MLCPVLLWAQFSISGKISEKNNVALIGASVKLKGKKISLVSNADGMYELANLLPGNYVVMVSYVGFSTQEKSIYLQANSKLDFMLLPLCLMADEIAVSATRAAKNSASAYRNMNKEEIAKYNHGQDLPYLLNQIPSVVATSDAGTGIGYTGVRIRGNDITQINVTLNGIPLNDAESQGCFFVNLPDFASSIDNIQIQRGVGASANGTGAFGASLNIQTTTRTDSVYVEINNTIGSFNSLKNTLNVGSGLINNKFTFDARLSRIKSDGYVDRASSNLKSFFITGAYYGKNDILRTNVFSGSEKTYQAWNGIDEETLKTNRTHNDYTYDNQTDNYQQDHYQLLYTRNLNAKLVANAALHYTYGRGYYEQYKGGENLADYNIKAVTAGTSVINQSDLVQRLWLDNDFYGVTYSLIYTPQSDLNITLGGAYNQYKGRHFDEVIWAQFANYDASNSLRHIYNKNNAFKTDFNIYAKGSYRLNKLNIFADLQYRSIFYSYFGFDEQASLAQQWARLTFFNPKFGLSCNINPKTNIYASAAVGHKEPNRDDFIYSNTISKPNPESLIDFEAGYRTQKNKFTANLNGFAMIYKNQLINTGQLTNVGGSKRQNVPNSYRLGIEFEGRWQILKTWYWQAAATLSQNKIKAFTEYVYDKTGLNKLTNLYHHTEISFSPSMVASSEIGFNPFKNAEIAFLSKYVGKQYLDNTQSDGRKLSAFFLNDVRLDYQFAFTGVKNVALTLLINNIFNEKYQSNGSVYMELINEKISRYTFYYPQATANFLLSLNVKF